MDLGATGKTGRVLARQLCLSIGEHGLSDQERQFADAYLANGCNTGDAYIACRGPETKRGTARKVGAEWLRRDHVRAYIEQRRTEIALEMELTQQEVVAYYRTVVQMGLGRKPMRRSRCDSTGKPVGEPVEVFDTSLSAVNAAAAGLAKFLGVDQAAQTIEWSMQLAGQANEDAGRG